MLKRKSHTKSRNGCTNCKARRIKCDEKGPPCANCAARSWSPLKCVYEPTAPRQPATQIITRKPPSTPTPRLPLPRLSSSQSLSPVPFSNTAPTNHLLELELLHRWTARTWTAFYTIPDCKPYLIDHLPRQALQHSYLLNGIFASAAMDLAVSSPSPGSYLRAALEYGNRASTEFRQEVKTVTPDNIDLVAYFSSMSCIVSFVAPENPDGGGTALTRVTGLIDGWLASTRIGIDKLDWLLASPCTARKIAVEYAVDLKLMDRLDASTKTAIELLSSVVRHAVLPDGRRAGEVWAYVVAVGQTKYSFAEEVVGRMQKYYTTLWPIAGEEFVAAVRARESMALFVMLYWAVLVERAAKREWGAWVLGVTGRELVEELSELLAVSRIAAISGVMEGIAWTRAQVGLPPLGGYAMPAGLSGVVGEDDPGLLWRGNGSLAD